MEHQTLTSMGDCCVSSESTIAHELAHQWWGDLVTCADWHHIWLNEGFATYAEWLWFEEIGLGTVDATAERTLTDLPPDGWPLAAPDEMFGVVSYQGGATVLHALRLTVGDREFFAGLRNWVTTYLDGAATTREFQEVMEAASGTDLDGFFDAWVYAESIPSEFPS